MACVTAKAAYRQSIALTAVSVFEEISVLLSRLRLFLFYGRLVSALNTNIAIFTKYILSITNAPNRDYPIRIGTG